MVGLSRDHAQHQVSEGPSRVFPDEARNIRRESLEAPGHSSSPVLRQEITPPPDLPNRGQRSLNRSETLGQGDSGELSSLTNLPTMPTLDRIEAFEDQILREYTTKEIRNGREVMVPKPGFDEAYQRVIALRESYSSELHAEKRAWLNRLADTVGPQSSELADLLRDPTRGGSLNETQAQQLVNHLFMILYAREQTVNTKNLTTMINEEAHELEERVEWALTWQDKLLAG